MTRLHEGWDYLLYKIYIWGGLAALVAYILVSALVFHTDSQPSVKTYAGPVTLYLFGIVAYWWLVFLFKGRRELKALAQEQPQSHPELGTLKSWSTLHQAMALYGGNTDELIKAERAGRLPVLVWYGGVNLLMVWILGCLWMGWLGILPSRPNHDVPADPYFPIMIVGIFVWIGLMVVGTPFLAGWASKGGEAAYLAPLGLALVESPSVGLYILGGVLDGGQATIPAGATIMEGSRHGRLVHVETMGEHCYTLVQAELAPFTVHSQEGKLVADEGAPRAVIEALKGMRKAQRWRGIQVTGSTEGVAVERESKGQNMWLYDLWLAERLLEGWDARP
jgi:hypothetical protein